MTPLETSSLGDVSKRLPWTREAVTVGHFGSNSELPSLDSGGSQFPKGEGLVDEGLQQG